MTDVSDMNGEANESTDTWSPSRSSDGFKAGFTDGHAGSKREAIDRAGFGGARDYEAGYDEGRAARSEEDSALQPPDGPAIGPLTDDMVQGSEDTEREMKLQEQARELREEIGREIVE